MIFDQTASFRRAQKLSHIRSGRGLVRPAWPGLYDLIGTRGSASCSTRGEPGAAVYVRSGK